MCQGFQDAVEITITAEPLSTKPARVLYTNQSILLPNLHEDLCFREATVGHVVCDQLPQENPKRVDITLVGVALLSQHLNNNHNIKMPSLAIGYNDHTLSSLTNHTLPGCGLNPCNICK